MGDGHDHGSSSRYVRRGLMIQDPKETDLRVSPCGTKVPGGGRRVRRAAVVLIMLLSFTHHTHTIASLNAQ